MMVACLKYNSTIVVKTCSCSSVVYPSMCPWRGGIFARNMVMETIMVGRRITTSIITAMPMTVMTTAFTALETSEAAGSGRPRLHVRQEARSLQAPGLVEVTMKQRGWPCTAGMLAWHFQMTRVIIVLLIYSWHNHAFMVVFTCNDGSLHYKWLQCLNKYVSDNSRHQAHTHTSHIHYIYRHISIYAQTYAQIY